jgi:hypothetical protein
MAHNSGWQLWVRFGPTISSNLRQTSSFLLFFTTQTLCGGDPHRASKSAIAPTVSVHTAVRFQLDHDFFKRRLDGSHAATTGRAGTCPRR